MNVPDVSPMQFAALAVLLDGRVHRNGKIARAIGHKRPTSFTIVLRSLEARGLVDRVRWAPAAGDAEARGRRTLRGYRISQAGRSAWRETLDYYLFFANRFAPGRKRTGHAEGDEAARVDVAPFAPFTRLADRLANESEAAAIAAAASPELRRLLRAAECGPLGLEQLVALDVEDVDLVAPTLRVRGAGRRLPMVEMGPALVAIVSEAAGDRKSGPVFRTSAGRRWTKSAAAGAFADARERAGVAREVKLIGRTNQGRGAARR
jgi:integrase